MQDRIPLYPGRVTLTPVEGQANTYDMVRADQPTQVGTALSKANLLKDLTAAQFGLDENAVPDDVFSWLGKYNEHWWSALHGQASSYTKYGSNATNLTSDTALVYPANLSSKETYTISYSEKISCDATGVNLISPITKEFTNSTSSSGIKTLRNSIEDFFNSMPFPCYISCTVSTVTGVFYLPSGSTIKNSSSALYTATVTIFGSSDDPGVSVYLCAKDSLVTVKPQSVALTSEIVTIPAGETTYEHSTDRNAYPDSGTQDGITYTYLGVPFEKFPTMPAIEQGSYTGTGVYGSNNANKLTFDFAPKLLMIRRDLYAYGSASKSQNETEATCIILDLSTAQVTDDFTSATAYNAAITLNTTISATYGDTVGIYVKKSTDGKTIAWKGPSTYLQLNISGKKYYYTAFG